MKKQKNYLLKDTIIILFIILVFIAVILIIYSEIIKNNNIRTAKNNFFFVKEEILESINKCNVKLEERWTFGDLCSQAPEIENITQYFNSIKKLINPHNNNYGVEEGPGSVLIRIDRDQFILSIDIDANGGIDIQQKIYF